MIKFDGQSKITEVEKQATEKKHVEKKHKFFIQVNTGNEEQKSGVKIN